MSALKWIVIAIGASAILVITLPLELILIPAAIVAAIIPSARANYHWCRNCKWSDRVVSKATN
ncbi:MAG TPA: hypothetical protein VKR52_04680 [Terracidiphilus sp.]|nr:hypothetical protein [Terracidiphilus sp.]